MKTKNETQTSDVISGSQLLQEIIATLTENLNGIKLMFKNTIDSEIADDSDQHRTKRGYMSYKEFTLFEKNGKKWALAFGTKTGDYPGNNFQSDLIAFSITEKQTISEIKKEIAYVVPAKSHFKNSFMIVTYDGQLMMRTALTQLIGEKMGEFIAREARYTPNFNMDGTRCVELETSYKKEGAIFIADKLQSLLV
ncbi:MAG: hypothetical protein WCW65_03100 [Candidatus Paceibacterota bacterium]